MEAYGGHERTVAFLISKGASTEWRDDEGRMPILWACEKGHVGAVRVLLEHMGEEGLEETDYDGYTGLHWAALEGHEALVTFLIGEGAQPDIGDQTGILPIMSACERGHLGVVQLLVQHMGDEVLQARDADARTVLHFAAYWGREKVVAFLLGKGAQANSRDRLGKIPLMWACERGQMGVVRMLLQHMGAQGLREAAKTGWMALHWAVHGGQEEVVAFLIGEGAGVNSRDHHGFVPLMVAAVHGHLGVVKMLLRHVEAEALQERGWDGMTALHLAAYKDHPEVVRLLLLAGADPTVVDDGGMTPRALAEDWGHLQCMAVFQWWEGELKRRTILHRAMCLHKAYTMQGDVPTSQVPTYLAGRVAAGHAVPSVEVVLPLWYVYEQQKAEQEGLSGKRKAAGDRGDTQEADFVGDEMHAVLEYVVKGLNEELFTELLGGFHSNV